MARLLHLWVNIQFFIKTILRLNQTKRESVMQILVIFIAITVLFGSFTVVHSGRLKRDGETHKLLNESSQAEEL